MAASTSAYSPKACESPAYAPTYGVGPRIEQRAPVIDNHEPRLLRAGARREPEDSVLQRRHPSVLARRVLKGRLMVVEHAVLLGENPAIHILIHDRCGS